MDQARQDPTSRCPVCGGSRWWRSRTGHEICQRCHPGALEALQALANQTHGAILCGTRMSHPVIDESFPQITAEHSVDARQDTPVSERCFKVARDTRRTIDLEQCHQFLPPQSPEECVAREEQVMARSMGVIDKLQGQFVGDRLRSHDDQ